MEQDYFEKLVNEGIREIPEKFLKRLDNVEIVIQDEPSSFQLGKIKNKKGSYLFGLYEGIPQTARTHYDQALPDKITIFKKPIEKFARSESEAREIVKNTVWHEIAHHFGMDEDRVKQAEIQRKRLKKI